MHAEEHKKYFPEKHKTPYVMGPKYTSKIVEIDLETCSRVLDGKKNETRTLKTKFKEYRICTRMCHKEWPYI